MLKLYHNQTFLCCLHVPGDVRLTPFYDPEECMMKLQSYVDDLNKGQTEMVMTVSGLLVVGVQE